MTNLYDKSPRGRHHGSPNPQTLQSAILSFLATCRRPAVLDFGDSPIDLQNGNHVLECRSGKLTIEAWNDERSLSRCILDVQRMSPGVLDCTVQRFGGATGDLSFLDLDRPQAAVRFVRASRQTFGEQFRRMLYRQFPGWAINTLSAAKDLRRSFSTVFPRAHLSRGNQHIAALACPSTDDEAALLTFALLWFDYLLGRIKPGEKLSLVLFFPESAGALSAHRLRWLAGHCLLTRLFRFNPHGLSGEVDAQDLGNIETRVSNPGSPSRVTAELQAIIEKLSLVPEIGCCPEITGAISLRFRGLEFARVAGGELLLGIDSKENIAIADAHKLEAFAAHLGALGRSSGSGHAELPQFPERWFESAVRAHLQTLDPELLPTPVHGQVLTAAAGDRELIDLLAVTPSGRLAVLELKTSEDLHLPIQGLDYWMHTRWHAERTELSHLFPGHPISPQPPKLFLVAPALAFHPANEIVLRYFSPEIEVERIGVNSDWESALKVVFRLRGAERPISHQGTR